MNKETVLNRIKKIIDDSNLTNSEFAEKIGVPKSSISHLLSERNKPSLDLITKISENFEEITLDYLIFGVSEVKKDKISKLLDEAYDELNKSKHREDYEELIHDLEDLVDTNILNHIMENKDNLLSEDLSNPASMQEIERINELDKLI